jgi:hypothetical protein
MLQVVLPQPLPAGAPPLPRRSTLVAGRRRRGLRDVHRHRRHRRLGWYLARSVSALVLLASEERFRVGLRGPRLLLCAGCARWLGRRDCKTDGNRVVSIKIEEIGPNRYGLFTGFYGKTKPGSKLIYWSVLSVYQAFLSIFKIVIILVFQSLLDSWCLTVNYPFRILIVNTVDFFCNV